MKKYIPVFIQLIVFNFIMIIYFAHYINTSTDDNICDKNYNNNWDVISNSEEKHFDILPKKISTNNTNEILLTKTLSDITEETCIGFFSFQKQVFVYIDNEEIFSFVPDEDAKSKTPGNKWIFIPLKSDYESKELSIKLVECYSGSSVNIPDMHLGTSNAIMTHYLTHLLPRCILSCVMIIFGIIYTIYFVLYITKKEQPIQRGVVWLGLFAIYRGFWTLIEGNIYSFFIDDLLPISRLSYLCLKMAVTTFLLFISYTYHNNKNRIFGVLIYLSFADFVISIILQYTGILDFAYTVYITHAILLFGCIYTCYNLFFTLWKNGKDVTLTISRKRRTASNAQLGASVFLLAGSLIDLVRYYIGSFPDVAKYSRIADIIYIFCVSFALIVDATYLLKTGQEAAIIKENASLDPMTKLFNRAAYEKELQKIKNLKNIGIIMLDLNNLKSFNDKLGHDAGDEYIIEASQIINNTFHNEGKIFRIGGDEFCIITHHLKPHDFYSLQSKLEKDFSQQFISDTDFSIGISTGFALYDSKSDRDIKDIIKRADESMYQRKSIIKGSK